MSKGNDEWIHLEVNGSVYGEKWKDFRIEHAGIVVKTYPPEIPESHINAMAEAHKQRRRGRIALQMRIEQNPENPRQLVRFVRWRIHHKPTNVCVEVEKHAGCLPNVTIYNVPINQANFNRIISRARTLYNEIDNRGRRRGRKPKDETLREKSIAWIAMRMAKDLPISKSALANFLNKSVSTLDRHLPNMATLKEEADRHLKEPRHEKR